MCVVEDDGGIALELGVVDVFVEERIVCHALEEGGTRFSHVFERDSVADMLTELDW